MTNDNFYPGQAPGQPLGTGEGESPLAKPVVPNADVRTMGSDLGSINTGASAPKPYAPPVSAPENIPLAPTAPTAPVPSQSFQIPQMDAAGESKKAAPKKSSKGIFTALIVFIVVIGLAALGYFVIYPIFFAAPAEIAPAPATPVLPAPTPAAATAPNEPTPITGAPAPALPHISLFTTPPDTTTVTTDSGLSVLALNTSAAPGLSEIVYKDSAGNLVKFTDILKSATGLDLSSNQVLATAFDDQTAAGLVYTDSNGNRWLGFTAQLMSGSDRQNASAAFEQSFEAVGDYSGLFSSNPGTAQTWKAGQIAGVTDNRYLLFGNAGFALDYGWTGNKLIIVTSYSGFKEAAKRLQ